MMGYSVADVVIMINGLDEAYNSNLPPKLEENIGTTINFLEGLLAENRI
jgi:hypothetical protein